MITTFFYYQCIYHDHVIIIVLIAVSEEGPKSLKPTFDTMFDYYSKWGNQVCRF